MIWWMALALWAACVAAVVGVASAWHRAVY